MPRGVYDYVNFAKCSLIDSIKPYYRGSIKHSNNGQLPCLLRFEDYREVLDLVSELFVAAFASANKTFKGLIDWLRVCTSQRLSLALRRQVILF